MDTYSRADWGAQHGRGSVLSGAQPLVVIHHSYRPALQGTETPEQEAAAVRGIERFHALENGWDGIGYNWLVAPSGRVYEGRGWGRKGAHAGPVNGSSVGICLLIDGDKQSPSAASIRSVRTLIATGVAKGKIAPDYRITGHRDHMARDCPGDLVYARLSEFRHDAAAPPAPAPRPPHLAVPAPDPERDMVLAPITVPTAEHVEEAARRLQVPEGVLCDAALVVEALMRAVSAGARDPARQVLAAELTGAFGAVRQRRCG